MSPWNYFLWWYWLLLLCIVGVPMLLAVRYVARHPAANDDEKQKHGETAAWIFWVGTIVVAIAAFCFVNLLLWLSGTKEPGHRDSRDYSQGWYALVVQFFIAIVATVWTNTLIRKRKWYCRVPLLVICIIVYLFLIDPISISAFQGVSTNLMQFLVCMLPAHFWGEFRDSPDTPKAWIVLYAFLGAATLFFIVS